MGLDMTLADAAAHASAAMMAADTSMTSYIATQQVGGIYNSPSPSIYGGISTDEQQRIRLRTVVNSASKMIKVDGPIELGDEIYVMAIEIEMSLQNREEYLSFKMTTPDGKGRVIQGPVRSFQGCRSLKEIVVRGLQYSTDPGD